MGVHTKEDEIETKRIYDEVLVPIFGDSLGEYKFESILAHTSVNGIILQKGEYRNDEKDTVLIPNETFLIHFGSDINPAGIGDGREPNVARTYSISMDVFNAKRRLYRHNEFHEYNLGTSGYMYARTLDELREKLINKINEYQDIMNHLIEIN